MKCKKCEAEFEVLQLLGNHSKVCGVEKVVPKLFDKICKCGAQFQSRWRKSKFCPECHDYSTEESRRRISAGRKKWLAENPDRHPWKNHKKFHSVPCEIFKKELSAQGLLFESELTPVPGRYFSLDIAFPTKRIGVEINGNQHYNADKTLKKYYQDRHDLIVAEGWQVLELHYSIAFQKEKLAEAVQALKDCIDKVEFEYEFYLPTRKVRLRKRELKQKEPDFEQGHQVGMGALSPERLGYYRTKLQEVDVSKKGFITRAAKAIGVSGQQVRRVIKNHLPEFVEYLNTPSKFLPEEKRKPVKIVQTKKERLEEYRTKIIEIGPKTPSFRKQLAAALKVNKRQVGKIIRKHFPELRIRSNK